MPYDVAKKRGVIDEDAAAEVDNCIVYFICASSIHLRAEMAVAMEGLSTLWSARTTSSNVTEYMRSLPISTLEETTGETATVVSQ